MDADPPADLLMIRSLFLLMFLLFRTDTGTERIDVLQVHAGTSGNRQKGVFRHKAVQVHFLGNEFIQPFQQRTTAGMYPARHSKRSSVTAFINADGRLSSAK